MFFIGKKINILRRAFGSVQPSPVVLEAGRRRLEAFMAARPAERPATPASRGPGRRPVSAWSLGYRFASVAAVAVATLGGGSAVLAHEALPGDLLYPVKIAAERFVAGTKLSAQARASYESALASRRLAEVKMVIDAADGREERATIALDLYREAVEKIAHDREAGGPGPEDKDARGMFTAHQLTLNDIEGTAGEAVRLQAERSLLHAVALEERLERAARTETARPIAEQKRRIAEDRLDHQERRLRRLNRSGEISVEAEMALGDAIASIVESEVLLESGELDLAYTKAREALRLSLPAVEIGPDDEVSDIEE